jgi:hypothetical protein
MDEWLMRDEIAKLIGNGESVSDAAVRHFLSRAGITSVTHYPADQVRQEIEHRRQSAKARASKHGTASHYFEHKCRCDACKEAAREYRKVLAEKNASHGNTTGYNRGCRCDACKEAGRQLCLRRKSRTTDQK